MHADEVGDHNRLSERIIGCAFRVINTLGIGFLEKVYENALAHELRKSLPQAKAGAGLAIAQQHGITVKYGSIIVGEYSVDLLVESTIIAELKSLNTLNGAHVAQCLNDLKATGLPLCLLLNFGKPRLEIQRFSHSR